MKYNTEEVASLAPDYLGFIFYEKSPRNYTTSIVQLSSNIQKVGVFVNEEHSTIVDKVKEHSLQILQLHGNESPTYVFELREQIRTELDIPIEIWKVFLMHDSFDLGSIAAYEPYADKFLFDTKGDQHGGNGIPFNWNALRTYPSNKPFLLSGGIGPDSGPAIERFKTLGLPLHGIDVNSLFETEPGRKNLNDLKTFINEL